MPARRHPALGAGNTLDAVQAEYDALVAPIAADSGCTIDVRLKLVRDAYSIDPDTRSRSPSGAATRT